MESNQNTITGEKVGSKRVARQRSSEVKQRVKILELISEGREIMIEALNGKAYISHTKKTFVLPVDEDFKNLGLNKRGPATPETLLEVREIVADGSFFEVFSSLDPNLDRSVMTQAQIIRFCKKHPDWLRNRGLSTLFLTKHEEEYYVVNVCRCEDYLFVYVHSLIMNNICRSKYRYRVISPKLTN